ncbi:MAG TPA: glycosyltransferase family 4 protein [Gaiellaceae bacterium]|nr:glycosyltransferase family 4 protein [Gaiellaceae bacterium]
MKVLIVSGIWPPDVGGPASHAPEVAAYLQEHGHQPHVLVTAARQPAPASYPVDWISRSQPPGVRHAKALAAIRRLARRADVVYSTGMFGRSGVGSLLARRPYVLKLTADPAFERARRRGLFEGSLAEFQQDRSARTLPFRAARDAIVRRAAHVVCPSAYLAELTAGWGVPGDRVDVLPNPAPDHGDVAARDEARARHGFDGPTLVFAGRLTEQKALDLAIEAARRAGARLVVVGDGPERARLERLGGATFLGPQPRETVLELFRAADASILSSAWENFPHGIVESLAVGTPVIATAVGGVGEVVVDGENGLLVPPGDVDALSAAVERYLSDGELAARLRAHAGASVERYSRERVYGRLLEILAAAA